MTLALPVDRLDHLVDRAASHAADREAFVAPQQRVTYGALATRADRLAHLLIDQGVAAGDRVGIFMPRVVDSALAVYGILKAGAAFVPIDPQLPVEGLRRLLEDCGIRHVVTLDGQAGVLRRLAAGGAGCLRVVVGTEALDASDGVRGIGWQALDAMPAGAAPVRPRGRDDLAYLMYSSGSTGRPKGIVHTHGSGLAYARLSVETYGVGAEDRIGNHSPLHFDMSTFGYFSSPYASATTLIVPEAFAMLTASLSQLMADERLTIWYSVPRALIQLLARGVLDERDLSSLRWVLFGGEPFARKHVEALQAHWPQARFSNVYGPAEVNQCTYHHLPSLPPAASADVPGDGEAAARRHAEPIPIGQIWAETEGRVLHPDGRPAQVGEAGELLIRSPTMMRGYWGRPELDARCFATLPGADGGETTFYRTGDLVQLGEDGELLFLGRLDRQVKVRGFRVELDEVERSLAAHPEVEEVAVFPLRVDGQVEDLRAAVTLCQGATVRPGALRAFLRARISAYAVPAAIEVVDGFPRTTSGKIDRRRLQTETESALAEPAPARGQPS